LTVIKTGLLPATRSAALRAGAGRRPALQNAPESQLEAVVALAKYFLGAKFESCRVVPATVSVEAAVRAAIPNPRRREGDISGWGRM